MNPFDAALKRLENEEKEKKEKEQNRGSYDFENVQWVGFNKNTPIQVIRILGDVPWELRSEPWHPKLIHLSKALNDEGKMINVIWQQKLDKNGRATGELDDKWFLMKFYQKVTDFKWKPKTKEEWDAKTPGVKLYTYGETVAFKRIENNKKADAKFVTSFYPRRRVLLNVIHREDNSWCVENKHSKVFCTKLDFGENDEVWNDVGIPIYLYNEILKEVVKLLGHWNIDLIITQKKGVKTEEDVEYIIKDAEDATSDKRIPDFAKALATKAPLTKEELEYEKYDFDKLYKVTSYRKIHKNLSGLIKMFDAEAGTTFFEELEELVAKEKEAAAKAEAASESKSDAPKATATEAPKAEKVETPVSEPPKAEPAKRASKAAPQAEESIEDKAKKAFPKYDSLSDEDKKTLLSSIDSFKGNVPTWKANVSLIKCDNDKCFFEGSDVETAWPDSVFHCANCGMEYSASDETK